MRSTRSTRRTNRRRVSHSRKTYRQQGGKIHVMFNPSSGQAYTKHNNSNSLPKSFFNKQREERQQELAALSNHPNPELHKYNSFFKKQKGERNAELNALRQHPITNPQLADQATPIVLP